MKMYPSSRARQVIETNRSDETMIRQVLEDIAQAVRRRDMQAILAAYAPDAVIFDVRDVLQTDKVGLRRSWDESFTGSKEYSYEIRDLTITASGDIAIAHSLTHAVGKTTNDYKIDLWLRATHSFRKVDGRWFITHEHVSLPGDFETGLFLWDLKPMSSLKH